MEVRKNRNGVNKMSLYIGTNYHPHDWPKERWEKDFQLMKEAGFDTVRLGHLCWDSYEPEDGVYTFEWFDQVMELCVKYKLNVILDVSMHPAPIWVHKLCPGCNVGGKNGAPQAPLRRYMDDVSDPEYQKYALRFAEKSFPVIKIIRRCLRLDCAMSWEQAIHPILKRRRRDFRNGWKRNIKQ